MQATREAITSGLELPDRLSLPLEIRVHGRGGQGGVTCAKLLAALFSRLGLAVQTFGDYGSERSGAPVQAFTRVDRSTVANRNKVYRPDHLLVLDPGLLATPVLSGVAPGALILVNAPVEPELLGERYRAYRLATVAATEIAREQGIGSSSVVIVNTTLAGAYARLLGLPLSLLEEVYAALGVAGDLAAAELAYDRVKVREAEATPSPLACPPHATVAAPVAPLTAAVEDIPVRLPTGLWSNQSPRYRTFTAPCSAACPAGNDVAGFVHALKEGGPDAAAAILLRTQALPSVCGRVCPAPCMSDCNRSSFDGAVNVRSLERWIADHACISPAREKVAAPRSFAVVGGGPAGLSAAYQLALRGHRATIFEAEPLLGGVLRYGIPAFRLPDDVLDRDLARIMDLGVSARAGSRIGSSQLRGLAAEFDGVIVGTGFGAAHRLGVPGEELAGVEQGLPFLERAKLGEVALAGQVVVVGGGNSAIDCARSALRLGAASVRLAYRRSREDMPAIEEEIAEAELEGVRLMTMRQPVAFLGAGRLEGVVLAEVEPGPPDADGRRRPVVTDRTTTLTCDHVLLALGQGAGLEFLPDDWRIEGGRAWRGVDPLAVFFAGDCATGEGTVTHAIGNGRRAALAALESMAAREVVPPGSEAPPVVAPAQIRFSHFQPAHPARDRHLAASAARESFQEFNLGLSGPEEAERCFSCGQCTKCDTCLIYCPDGVIARNGAEYLVDPEFCKGCGMCVAECPRCAMEMQEKLPGGEI